MRRTLCETIGPRRPGLLLLAWLLWCLANWQASASLAEDNLPAKPTVPAGVVYEPGLVYGKGGDETLYLDLARPEQIDTPTPCVVVIHGGAWRAGHRRAHTDLILQLAERGYVAATVSYRFCPEHPFPAQIEDVKCAVRFLRAHADRYRLDPERIGAVGFSAGAHLALLLGTMGPEDGLEGQGGWPEHSSRVKAVVSVAGPTKLDAADIPEVSKPLVRDLLGGSAEERPDEYRRASPVTYVSAGDAAFLLFQGTTDPLVPYTQAIHFTEAATAAGLTGRAEILFNLGHGWAGDELERTRQATFRFLEQALQQP